MSAVAVPDIDAAIAALAAGDRRALSRWLTYAESGRAEHRAWVSSLLSRSDQDPATGFRVAFSGPPGAGKSSLIERLGLHATEHGKRVAVLAIDPSSERTGGSLLADKTRMQELSTSGAAFVRPSPNKGQLGGILSTLPISVRLCELAGYDYVLIETVGVGQAEGDAADLVDCFVLVLSPQAGDEIQGMKRGITELCDVLVVNKCDTDPDGAQSMASAYRAAFGLFRENPPKTLNLSAHTGQGLAELWKTLVTLQSAFSSSGQAAQTRRLKAARLFRKTAERALLKRLLARPQVAKKLDGLQGAVSEGRASLHGALQSVEELAL